MDGFSGNSFADGPANHILKAPDLQIEQVC